MQNNAVSVYLCTLMFLQVGESVVCLAPEQLASGGHGLRDRVAFSGHSYVLQQTLSITWLLADEAKEKEQPKPHRTRGKPQKPQKPQKQA